MRIAFFLTAILLVSCGVSSEDPDFSQLVGKWKFVGGLGINFKTGEEFINFAPDPENDTLSIASSGKLMWLQDSTIESNYQFSSQNGRYFLFSNVVHLESHLQFKLWKEDTLIDCGSPELLLEIPRAYAYARIK